LPGELYAAFRRSEVPAARIRSIDIAEALRCPGVHSVLLGSDFPAGFGTLQPVISYEGRGGSRVITPERPLLARERVRFAGEEIAVVLARSPALALDAVERIAVEYADTRAAIRFDGALRAEAPQVHDCVPGNICFDFDYGDEAATASLLAQAPHRVEVSVESPRVSAVPMEPRSVLAWYDAAKDIYEIRCSNQGGDLMATQLAILGGFGPRPTSTRWTRMRSRVVRTLFLSTPSEVALNPLLYATMNYEPLKDLAPISLVAIYPNVMVVNASVSASTVNDVLALAKKTSGGLHYGSSGTGSTQHLAGEWLQRYAGFNWVHVPYKGAAPATTDIVGGQIPVAILGLGAIMPHIKSGRLRAIAVTSTQRTGVTRRADPL
jgi:hypothetical protein